MRILGWDVSAVRVQTPHAPPTDLHRAYRDATMLVLRCHAGRAWSRRHSKMQDRRWRAAYALLRQAEIIGDGGEMEMDFLVCLWKLWWHHSRQQQLRANGNFVPARLNE